MPAYPSQEEVAQADHQLQLNADAETGIWPAFDSWRGLIATAETAPVHW